MARVIIEAPPAQRVKAAALFGAVVASRDPRSAEQMIETPGAKIDWESGVVYTLPEIPGDVFEQEGVIGVASQMNMIDALSYIELET